MSRFDFLPTEVSPLIMSLLLTGFLIYPLCSFLVHGWKRKKEEVDSSLVANAKRTYLEVFWNRSLETKTSEEVDQEFSAFYARRYGRERFVVPILILCAVSFPENLCLAKGLIRLLTPNNGLDAVTAAIAGAYTYVAWDFVGRAQRRNLVPADILRGALRITIAVPVGLAFVASMREGVAPFIAFAVGAFPLNTLQTVFRRVADDKLKLGIVADVMDDQIPALNGVDRWIADRIEDADMTTIPQLAWCDPIDLSMRSSLPLPYVIDIVGQALAWVYFADKLKQLRSFGLRGAFEMKVLMDGLAGKDQNTKAKADAVLPAAAAAANIPRDGFVYALFQIAEDPATLFLYAASKCSTD
ncbi:hypothetical protein QA635_39160 [Bradyrhizobium brasilense]|uniref:hypothetical protein n=1 Tax=Bradyrhizobium brasilense TaxID=1419277 RepID=UPI0024B0A344|nr:hypothetical protein [Bradyrhizobium australafricanum]WFU32432.1 hypothetical protein QA635_39160 [Bradyrhizobium australafricanum]